MKLTIYVLLTRFIKVLAGWRYKVGNSIGWQARWERDDMNLIASEYLSDTKATTRLGCCDCDLDHGIWVDNKGLHLVPWRPKNYKYSIKKEGKQ